MYKGVPYGVLQLKGIKITGGAIRGRCIVDGKRQDHKMKVAGMTEQRLEIREDGRTNALTTVQKDNVVVFKEKSQTLLATIYKENAKSMVKRGKIGLIIGIKVDKNISFGNVPCVMTEKRTDNKMNCLEEIYYRKLTPTECARLQTFPDGWDESVVSKTQAYKAYGNSWTVDVIAHIFKAAFQ